MRAPLTRKPCGKREVREALSAARLGALRRDLAKMCPVPVDSSTLDSPHTKAHLLFQAHFSRLQLPCSDYLTDLKSVLDQAIRILQVTRGCRGAVAATAEVLYSADFGEPSTFLLVYVSREREAAAACQHGRTCSLGSPGGSFCLSLLNVIL